MIREKSGTLDILLQVSIQGVEPRWQGIQDIDFLVYKFNYRKFGQHYWLLAHFINFHTFELTVHTVSCL